MLKKLVLAGNPRVHMLWWQQREGAAVGVPAWQVPQQAGSSSRSWDHGAASAQRLGREGLRCHSDTEDNGSTRRRFWP